MLVRVYVCDRENEIVKRKDRRVKTDRRTFDTKYTMAIYYVLLYGTKRSDIYNDIRCRWRRLLFSVRRIGMRRGSWEFCLKSSTTESVFLLPPSDSVRLDFEQMVKIYWFSMNLFGHIQITMKILKESWKITTFRMCFVSSRTDAITWHTRVARSLSIYMWIIYD